MLFTPLFESLFESLILTVLNGSLLMEVPIIFSLPYIFQRVLLDLFIIILFHLILMLSKSLQEVNLMLLVINIFVFVAFTVVSRTIPDHNHLLSISSHLR